MSDETAEWALLGIILVILVLTLSVCNPVYAEDMGSKSCFQVLTDSREAGKARGDNIMWIAEYLKPHGLDKTDPRYWHTSTLVHCILFRHETLLDAAKQLARELAK